MIQNMAWGVEELEVCERVALAVHAGVDIISGSYDIEAAKEAYRRGKEGYYTTQGHKVPEGYTVEQVTLSDQALTQAAAHTLKEKFELGLFENPYRDPRKAVEVVATKKDWENAADVHRKSVVLLKNQEALQKLPTKRPLFPAQARSLRSQKPSMTEEEKSLPILTLLWPGK